MSISIPSHTRAAAIAALILAAAAAAFAFGTKLMLVRTYGGGVPYMDEWDGIGLALFPRLADHTLRYTDFTQPHNEHRVVLTRLIAYGLAVTNGQWDPLLEMTANAALHAGFCAALLLFARRFFGGARLAFAALAITALFSLAFDWENTIQGFQSQFTLLEWCALGMFWMCLTSAPLSVRWFCGFGAGVAGLGSMSSGFFAAPPVLAVMILQAAFGLRWTWRNSVAALLVAALGAAGPFLYYHVPGHDILKAGSAGQWARALATVLAWPTFRWPAALLVLQFPVVAFFATRLRARRLEGCDAVLAALTLWVWLQVCALAYGRAQFGMVTSPRYTDLFAIQSVVNIIALATLWRGRPRATAAAWTALAAGWTALFVAGLVLDTRQSYSEFLGSFPRLEEAHRRTVRAFLATGDFAALKATPAWEMPFPSPEILATALRDPGILALLPVDVRPPLLIIPAAGSHGFSQASPESLPPGAGRSVWLAPRGPARLVTEPLRSGDLPLLHFEFCGSGDLDSSALHLESPQGTEAGPAVPLAAGHWRAADLALPPGLPVRLVVDVPPGDHWIAFTEPVEIGRESSAVRWLLRRSAGFTITAGAALGLALAALLAFGNSRKPRNEAPSAPSPA